MEPVEDHVDRVGSQRHGGRQHENAGDAAPKASRCDAVGLDRRQPEGRPRDQRAEADGVRDDRRAGVAVVAQPACDREPGRLDRTAAEHQGQEAALADQRAAERIAPPEDAPGIQHERSHDDFLPRRARAATSRALSFAAVVVVDLNADVGEGFADDPALLLLVTSANVACGFHAGDEPTMRAVCAAAIAAGSRSARTSRTAIATASDGASSPSTR